MLSGTNLAELIQVPGLLVSPVEKTGLMSRFGLHQAKVMRNCAHVTLCIEARVTAEEIYRGGTDGMKT